MKHPILELIPDLKEKVHPVSLIARATPLHTLPHLARQYKRPQILIKREDQTDTQIYGGNKVRNLEFVLGEALHRRRTHVSTLIAYGSNFTAAFAAQSKKVGLQAELSQFVLERNPQIEAHVDFGRKHNAKMSTFTGSLALPLAAAHAASAALRTKNYFVTPGASNVLGAIGHANAMLETLEQLKSSKLPDRIVVGAGTCGTIAGLIVGTLISSRTANHPIRITGVRCADSRICNTYQVARLVNKTMKFIGVDKNIRPNDVEIIDGPIKTEYAQTSNEILDVIPYFQALEGITLDTTYTAKVMVALLDILKTESTESLLYWHTFSPKAVS